MNNRNLTPKRAYRRYQRVKLINKIAKRKYEQNLMNGDSLDYYIKESRREVDGYSHSSKRRNRINPRRLRAINRSLLKELKSL